MKRETNTREQNFEDIKNTAQQGDGIPEKILNALPLGVSIIDEEGKFTFINTHYQKLFGYEIEELIGKHFSIIIPDEMKEKMNQLHQDFINHQSEFLGEWEVQRKNGETFRILVNAAHLYDIVGNPQKMTFAVDVSSLSISTGSLNATVEILNRKLEAQELAFHISNHDMRNNVGNISQLADLLRSTELDEKQNKYVDIIHQLSVRTLDMLKMSSDYMKMEKGDYQPMHSEFNLLQTLFAQIGAYSKEAESRGLTFCTMLNGQEVGFEKEELIIRADQAYVERMFGNLIGNAVEASPDGESIHLAAENGEKLLVKIHNQGAIPEEVRDNFFDKFITAGKEAGTGLGTYIAKLITDLHMGRIYFQTSEEVGTTLFVELPGEMIQQ